MEPNDPAKVLDELLQAVADAPSEDDAVLQGVYHFLDMGRQKYGECTVATFGKLRVLIDGGHKGDFDGQADTPSIPGQLEQIFGEPAPHAISLLVVTHCHDDHVGCLADLITEDIVRPRYALITHPGLGFGRGQLDDGSHDDLRSERTRVLTAALREEDASDLSDRELQDFLDAAGSVEQRYKRFVKALKDRNVKVIEYTGQALPQDLVTLMKPSGMKLLGPSEAQLLACAQQISRTNKDASDAVVAALGADATLDDVGLYRRIVNEETEADGRNPRGSGMNCQSITLAFGPKASRALLAGDMQFTEPGVDGAEAEVEALRAAVAAEGPYKLFKTTHHTSHNGQDADFLEELGSPPLIVHSGGLNDPSHPDPGTLRTLRKLKDDILFARTDRNGLITIRPSRPPESAIEVSKGKLNNFADNVKDILERVPPAGPVPPAVTAAPEEAAPVMELETAQPEAGPQIIIVNLPPGPVDMSVGGVDIIVRHPSPSGRAARKAPRLDAARPLVLAAGRSLPPLLFVTNPGRLEANVGAASARAVLSSLGAPHKLLRADSGDNADLRAVRDELKTGAYAGVVIVGGYDVVPAVAADVLPAALRRRLDPDVAGNEHDEFLVWSDELYGDVDDDTIAEYPVSRIPDARSADLLHKALAAGAGRLDAGFGIRNLMRPFAEAALEASGVRTPLKVSEKFAAGHVLREEAAAPFHYHMLHGRDSDATFFSGETQDGAEVVAFTAANVPSRFDGVVFSGCCWGALTVKEKACDVAANDAVTPRLPDESIALSYLRAGANAFVGCTGAHYSGPATDPRDNLALDFHKLFLAKLFQSRLPAASALHAARMDFGARVAQNSDMEPLALARRLKNRSQFTCLGLGW